MTPRRVTRDYDRWPDVAALIHRAFRYMDSILGHPPRASRLSAEDLADAAGHGSAWLIEDATGPVACAFTRPSREMPDALYLGWLAVADHCRGQGLTHRLFEAAEKEARAAGFAALTLDTGLALTELHRLFRHLGFDLVRSDGEVVTFRKALA